MVWLSTLEHSLWLSIKALTRIKLRCINKYAVCTNIGWREILTSIRKSQPLHLLWDRIYIYCLYLVFSPWPVLFFRILAVSNKFLISTTKKKGKLFSTLTTSRAMRNCFFSSSRRLGRCNSLYKLPLYTKRQIYFNKQNNTTEKQIN